MNCDMFDFDQIPLAALGLTGLEAGLSDEERLVQRFAHKFAAEVMRPVGEQLDRLTPAQVVAADSPLWRFQAAFAETGFLDPDTLAGMEPARCARLLPLVFEELGWGDVGLASLALANLAAALVTQTRPEFAAQLAGQHGCWLASQPDRGSDVMDFEQSETALGSRQGQGNLLAVRDGDALVLNGRSSAWIAGAPIADYGVVLCAGDLGQGLYCADGSLHQVLLLVPFDLPGIARGQAVETLGQRALPMGAVYFDEVRVPMAQLLAAGDATAVCGFKLLTFHNMAIAALFTGLARAAFEQALAYVHQRKQGGDNLIAHQAVRARLFDLWRQLEAMRALSQRAFAFNFAAAGAHALASVTSKTFVTEQCFELVSDALQLFGGNGLARDYPLEKLLRDARAGLIEGGENHMLGLKGAGWLSQWYQSQS